VFNAVAQGEGIVFFLDSPSGSNKTFIYSMLLASVRWDGHVTIRVASSSIIALLLEGGQTSNSVLKIPMCSIPVQNDFAELFWEAKLIVCDEAPA